MLTVFACAGLVGCGENEDREEPIYQFSIETDRIDLPMDGQSRARIAVRAEDQFGRPPSGSFNARVHATGDRHGATVEITYDSTGGAEFDYICEEAGEITFSPANAWPTPTVTINCQPDTSIPVLFEPSFGPMLVLEPGEQRDLTAFLESAAPGEHGVPVAFSVLSGPVTILHGSDAVLSASESATIQVQAQETAGEAVICAQHELRADGDDRRYCTRLFVAPPRTSQVLCEGYYQGRERNDDGAVITKLHLRVGDHAEGLVGATLRLTNADGIEWVNADGEFAPVQGSEHRVNELGSLRLELASDEAGAYVGVQATVPDLAGTGEVLDCTILNPGMFER